MNSKTVIKMLITQKDDDFLNDAAVAMNKMTGLPSVEGLPEMNRIEVSKQSVIRLSLNEYERASIIKESIDKGIWNYKKENKEMVQYVSWHQQAFDIKNISVGRKNSKKNNSEEKIIIPINLQLTRERVNFINDQVKLVNELLNVRVSKGDFIRFCIRALRCFMILKWSSTENNNAMKV